MGRSRMLAAARDRADAQRAAGIVDEGHDPAECHKKSYRSQQEALDDRVLLRARRDRMGWDNPEMYEYRCPRGTHWHLTTQVQDSAAAAAELRARHPRGRR